MNFKKVFNRRLFYLFLLITPLLFSFFIGVLNIKPSIAPTGIIVAFDEAHEPLYSTKENPSSPKTWGKCRNFYNDLISDGFATTTIDPGTSISADSLYAVDILICVAPQAEYSYSETAAILNFVQDGGRLFLISDIKAYSVCADSLAGLFGYGFAYDCLEEIDDIATQYNTSIILDSYNIYSYSMTEYVYELVMYAGTGVTIAPPTAYTIVETDNDGSCYYDFGETTANAEPLVSCLIDPNYVGNGAVVVAGDSSWWCDLDINDDGQVNYFDYDNEFLAVNIVNFLVNPTESNLTANTNVIGLNIGVIITLGFIGLLGSLIPLKNNKRH
ncbi:MAG: hypothetical protein EU542_05330 [Promethearchaeota archaeon]|nr:MAG: hypothetical protein EU542_05330 [Candidatus Lokiarchaeota archaeon]